MTPRNTKRITHFKGITWISTFPLLEFGCHFPERALDVKGFLVCLLRSVSGEVWKGFLVSDG